MTYYILSILGFATLFSLFVFWQNKRRNEKIQKKFYEELYSLISSLLDLPKDRNRFVLIYILMDKLTELSYKNDEMTSVLIHKFEQKYEEEFILRMKNEKGV